MVKYLALSIVAISLFSSIYFNNQKKENVNYSKYEPFVLNKKDQDYIGYIDIPKYNFKKGIKSSGDQKILDQGFIGVMNLNQNLDKTKNIILAGHNKKDIFNIITKLKINDIVKIITKKNIYNYKIKSIYELDKNDYFYFNEKSLEINLITCIKKNQKRLIVNGLLIS